MKNKIKKILMLSLDIFLFLLIFLLLTYLIFEKSFSDRIHPNVYVGGIEMSGLTRPQAEDLLKQNIESFNQRGIKISLRDRDMTWYNFMSSFDPDLASDYVFFNTELTIDQAYLVGRTDSWYYFIEKLKTLFIKNYINISFTVDDKSLKKMIEENFSELEVSFNDSSLWSQLVDGEIVFFIEPESSGREIDYGNFFLDFKNRVHYLNNEKIDLRIINTTPLVTLADSQGLELVASSLLDLAPFRLKDNKNNFFDVDKNTFADWLFLEPQFLEGIYVGVDIGLNFDKVSEFLDSEIRALVDQEPVRPHFEFDGNRVSVFEPGKDGLLLNNEKTFSNIKKSFSDRLMGDIEIVIEVDLIEDIGDVNNLGIEEIIGTGHSNFAGSPNNRRHNIRVGSNKLHGMILAPGEEFSVVKAIGKVGADTGYLPELVIKGNKTIPEYGGGLCQVSTTIFRTALAAGLPITERRNHSYRVVYYEPAGTDAAMYNPRPDLKFINDTENNILIQVRFEGNNDVYFDLWGKSDQRVVETSPPVVYNITQPGPTQIIETTDLKPGERKCTERAIAGADAYFDQKVIYNPGTDEENVVETRFHSKYVPWREVCLVGVAPVEEQSEVEGGQ